MALFYWTVAQFPEVCDLDPSRKRRLLAFVPRTFYLQLVLRSFGFALPVDAVAWLFWRGVVPLPFDGILFALLLAPLALFRYAIYLRALRVDVQSAIFDGSRGQRLPVCLHCGYDLRGTATDACPECGRNVHAPRHPPSQQSTQAP